MADTKITALPELAATPDTADILAIIDDPGVTPLSKKITVNNLISFQDARTAIFTNKDFNALNCIFADNADNTKEMGFDIVGATTGTKTTLDFNQTINRTITFPNATGTVALTSDKLDVFAATTSAELAGVISDETGSGLLVFGTSPTIVTPTIAATGWTNATHTHLAANSGGTITEASISDLQSYLLNIVEDTTPQLGGALDGQGNDLNNLGVMFLTEQAEAEVDVAGKGQIWVDLATPNILKFTDDAGTDFQIAHRQDNLSVFAATTSAQLAGIISDETGSGGLVFATSPTLVTPALGTPASGVLTNCTGLPIAAGLASGTKANLESVLSDVADIAEADGDTYSGAHLFNAATIRIPLSATPTMAVDGDFAIDTTITDFSMGLIKYFDGEEMAVISVPIAELTTPTGGHIISYNATNDEFELVAAGAADNLGDHTATQDLDMQAFDVIDTGNFLMNADETHLIDLTRTTAQADDYVIGEIRFRHDDGGAVLQNYARIEGRMESDVGASEDGSLQFYVTEAGVHDVSYMTFNNTSSARIDILKTLNLTSGNDIRWGVSTTRRILNDTSGFTFEVQTSDTFDFDINSVNELSVSATTINAPTATFQENGVNISPIGVHDIDRGATGWWESTTNGSAALAKTEIVSGNDIQTLDFDQTTSESAQTTFTLPRNWNNGTITATIVWTAASGSGTVTWGLEGGSTTNDDPLNLTYGTRIDTTDTLLLANDNHTITTAAITIGGSPADSHLIQMKISRQISDTLSADAKLISVTFHITTDAAVAA